MDTRAKAIVGAWVCGILTAICLVVSLWGPVEYTHWSWLATIFFGLITFVCVGAARDAVPPDFPMLPFGPQTADPPAPEPPRDDGVCPLCGHTNEAGWRICVECASPRRS